MTIARSASGAAKPTALTADIGTGDLVLAVEALTGTWADTTKGSFAATLNLGEADEERIVIESYTSTQLTCPSDGRGVDGYAAEDHESGCTVTPSIDGASWQDAQQHVVDTTRNDHTQYPFLTPGTVGHPTTGTWSSNDAVLDENGQLWVCTSGGSPGTWAAKGGMAAAYPVGAIYIELTGTNPATTFGFGTWVAYAAGLALIGVGTHSDGTTSETITVGEVLGEYKHLLAAAESGLPAHAHTYTDPQHVHGPAAGYEGFVATTGSEAVNYGTGGFSLGQASDTGQSYTNITIDDNTPADAVDGHNNIQPSIGVYVWHRTA